MPPELAFQVFIIWDPHIPTLSTSLVGVIVQILLHCSSINQALPRIFGTSVGPPSGFPIGLITLESRAKIHARKIQSRSRLPSSIYLVVNLPISEFAIGLYTQPIHYNDWYQFTLMLTHPFSFVLYIAFF